MLLFTIPGSIVPYKFKSKKWPRILTGISMIILWPFLMLQVLVSWHKADLKLRQGGMIETLK
jgi:succinate dehydrogenase/fumarate reductase cytochrome b subunit